MGNMFTNESDTQTTNNQQSRSFNQNNAWDQNLTQGLGTAAGNALNSFASSYNWAQPVQQPSIDAFTGALGSQGGLGMQLQPGIMTSAQIAQNGLTPGGQMPYYNSMVTPYLQAQNELWGQQDDINKQRQTSGQAAQRSLGNNTGDRAGALYQQAMAPARSAATAQTLMGAQDKAYGLLQASQGQQLAGASTLGNLTGIGSGVNTAWGNLGTGLQQLYQSPMTAFSQFSSSLAPYFQAAGQTVDASGSSSGTGKSGQTPSWGSQLLGGIGALASAYSDARIKENIEPIGLLFDGTTPVFKFNMKGDPTPQIGLIAQEVEQRMPEAVSEDQRGIKTVNYEMATRPSREMAQQGAGPEMGAEPIPSFKGGAREADANGNGIPDQVEMHFNRFKQMMHRGRNGGGSVEARPGLANGGWDFFNKSTVDPATEANGGWETTTTPASAGPDWSKAGAGMGNLSKTMSDTSGADALSKAMGANGAALSQFMASNAAGARALGGGIPGYEGGGDTSGAATWTDGVPIFPSQQDAQVDPMQMGMGPGPVARSFAPAPERVRSSSAIATSDPTRPQLIDSAGAAPDSVGIGDGGDRDPAPARGPASTGPATTADPATAPWASWFPKLNWSSLLPQSGAMYGEKPNFGNRFGAALAQVGNGPFAPFGRAVMETITANQAAQRLTMEAERQAEEIRKGRLPQFVPGAGGRDFFGNPIPGWVNPNLAPANVQYNPDGTSAAEVTPGTRATPGQPGSATSSSGGDQPTNEGARTRTAPGVSVTEGTSSPDADMDMLQGPQFMKAIEERHPAQAAVVKGILRGDIAPSDPRVRGTQGQKYLQWAQQADGGFSAAKWPARAQAYKEFNSAGTKTRMKIESANKVIDHLYGLNQAIENLHNDSWVPFGKYWRHVTNPILRGASGDVDKRFTQFETQRDLAMKELQAFLSGHGGGADRELQQMQNLLSDTKNQESLKGGVEQALHLMMGQLKPMAQTWANAYDLPDYDYHNLVDPQNRRKLSALEGHGSKAEEGKGIELPKPIEQMSLEEMNKLPPDKLSQQQLEAVVQRRRAMQGAQ